MKKYTISLLLAAIFIINIPFVTQKIWAADLSIKEFINLLVTIGVIAPDKISAVNTFLATLENKQTNSIKVLSPNGGETWKIGSRYDIKFNIIGDIKSEYKVALILSPGSVPLVIQAATPTSYGWTIPKVICDGGDACHTLITGQYKITARLYDSVPCVSFCPVTGAKLISSYDTGYFNITGITQ